MSENNKLRIQLVLNTLNQTAVTGKQNLDALLSSILTLEKVLEEENHADLDSNGNSDP